MNNLNDNNIIFPNTKGLTQTTDTKLADFYLMTQIVFHQDPPALRMLARMQNTYNCQTRHVCHQLDLHVCSVSCSRSFIPPTPPFEHNLQRELWYMINGPDVTQYERDREYACMLYFDVVTACEYMRAFCLYALDFPIPQDLYLHFHPLLAQAANQIIPRLKQADKLVSKYTTEKTAKPWCSLFLNRYIEYYAPLISTLTTLLAHKYHQKIQKFPYGKMIAITRCYALFLTRSPYATTLLGLFAQRHGKLKQSVTHFHQLITENFIKMCQQIQPAIVKMYEFPLNLINLENASCLATSRPVSLFPVYDPRGYLFCLFTLAH